MTTTQHSRGLGDTIARFTNRTGLSWFAEKAAKAIGLQDCGCAARQEILNELFPYRQSATSANSGKNCALTIGMAQWGEAYNTWHTVQSLRINHAEVMPQCEILVVDNDPTETGTGSTRQLIEDQAKGRGVFDARYIPFPDPVGTTQTREEIFRQAKGQAVLVIDPHVHLVPGAIKRLIEFYDAKQDDGNLLQGPMLYDDLDPAHSACLMEDIWRGGMWGTWQHDTRAEDVDGEPFEIPMHGLGLFSCRRSAWPGFNPHFRGFGGEEGYIHSKFRKLNKKTICLPWLRWNHWFGHFTKPPYPCLTQDRVRNYLIGLTELGLDPSPVFREFGEKISEADWMRFIDEADRLAGGVGTPGGIDAFEILWRGIGVDAGLKGSAKELWDVLGELPEEGTAVVAGDTWSAKVVADRFSTVCISDRIKPDDFFRQAGRSRKRLTHLPKHPDAAAGACAPGTKFAAVVVEQGNAELWRGLVKPGGILAIQDSDTFTIERI